MSRYYGWAPYVPVAVRRARAAAKMKKLRKKGEDIQPVQISGRKIATTFWGEAWCDHLESFSDFANRLPRGRTYVRNGSVCHLAIAKGEITALVSGSEIYKIKITIKPLAKKSWKSIKERCVGQVGSLLELLQGRLSDSVMSVVTDREKGLFPLPRDITLKCNCPDWAVMCKHVAAAMYGVGARLDHKPELLFLLRGVDQTELLTSKVSAITAATTGKRTGRKRIAKDELADVFGIDVSARQETPPVTKEKTKTSKRAGSRKKPGKPAASARKTPTRTRAPKPAESSPKVITGASIIAMRKKFKVNKSQLARILGVSPTTIGIWERRKGKLHLRANTLENVQAAARMTSAQAKRKLAETGK